MKNVFIIMLLTSFIPLSGCDLSNDTSNVLTESSTMQFDNIDYVFTNFWFGEIRYEETGYYTMSLTMDVEITNNREDTLATSQSSDAVVLHKKGSDPWGLPSGSIGSCRKSFLDNSESTTCSVDIVFTQNEGFTDYGGYKIFLRIDKTYTKSEDYFYLEIKEDALKLIRDTKEE
jgi:hypothetical protein